MKYYSIQMNYIPTTKIDFFLLSNPFQISANNLFTNIKKINENIIRVKHRFSNKSKSLLNDESLSLFFHDTNELTAGIHLFIGFVLV